MHLDDAHLLVDILVPYCMILNLEFAMCEDRPEKCACKGIRFCKICKLSERVQRLHLAHDLTKYDEYNCYIYKPAERCAILAKNINIFSSLTDIQEFSINGGEERLMLPGILLSYEFISLSEEMFLAEKIDVAKWQLSQSGRRKQDYGPKVNFKKQKVKVEEFVGIPDYADLLLHKIDKLLTNNEHGPFELFEMCNLEYTENRNANIEMHFDDDWIWGERLISVNLMSGTVLVLEDESLKRLFLIHLPRRSILMMSDESRHKYKHGIFSHHIERRRLVITMREAAQSFKVGGSNFEMYGKELSRRAHLRIST